VRGGSCDKRRGESSNFFPSHFDVCRSIKGGGGGNSALRVFCFIGHKAIDFTGAQKQKSSIKNRTHKIFFLILMFLKKMESGESRKDGKLKGKEFV